MPRLLLRDTVSLRIGGGYDEDGDPLPVQNVPIRAEVVPVSGETQALRGRDPTLTTYRLVVTDPRIEQVTKVVWRTQTYTLEGTPMPYKVNGRTHHYEVVMSRGAG